MIVDPTAAILFYFVLAVVWGVQFAQLMILDDASFPAPWDKLIWTAAFIFVFPVAPFAFLIWKKAYREYAKAVRDEKEIKQENQDEVRIR